MLQYNVPKERQVQMKHKTLPARQTVDLFIWNTSTFLFSLSASSHSSLAFLASQLEGSFSLLSSSTTSWWFSFRASFWKRKQRVLSWCTNRLPWSGQFETEILPRLALTVFNLTHSEGNNFNNSPVWNATPWTSEACLLFFAMQEFQLLR